MNYTQAVQNKFLDFADTYSLASAKSFTVAFSGGVDSTVLLHLMNGFCNRQGIKLSALHVNHMIRGEEADRDELFCVDFCNKLGINLTVKRFDIPTLCQSEGLGTEECARKYRYKALLEHVGGENDCLIATAHNANDNLETIIFNLTRGCSLTGIAGIPPKRDNIVRPIICCSKEEILGYATENSLPFVYDSTNSNTDYTRNKIRHKIIPILKEINPSIAEKIGNFSASVRNDDMYLKQEAEKYADVWETKALKELEAPILHRVILMKFAHNTECKLEYSHITALEKLIRQNQNNSFLSLPGKITVVIEGGRLCLRKSQKLVKADYIVTLSEGENIVSHDNCTVILCSDSDFQKKYNLLPQNLYKISIHKVLDFDKIDGAMLARSRKEGDSYKSGGMTRTLRKLFNNAKTPLYVRETLPVICDSSGIVWLPGFDLCDRVKVTSSCQNKYHLIYLKNFSET